VPKVSKSVVCVAIAPFCWVSKRHWTDVGPFVSMVPSISIGGTGPAQAAGTLTVPGLTSRVTLVTVAFGDWTTGMFARLPAALVTLTETQQFLLELNGSTIYHQVPSEFLPTICEVCPRFKPLRTSHAVPGPRRQLTATSLGDTVGTVGVGVAGGGEVFVGSGVCVGVPVGSDSVGERIIANVGVSVTVTFDGRLQAVIAKTSTSVDNKLRDFMLSPLPLKRSYVTMIPLETYPYRHPMRKKSSRYFLKYLK